LTTFNRSDGINNTNLNINDLTPARDGQDIPAKGGQGHRLFQSRVLNGKCMGGPALSYCGRK
jgi:hypothetical protein